MPFDIGRRLLDGPQQLIWSHTKRLGDLGYNCHRGVADAPFYPADVGAVQLRLESHLLLRKALCLPQAPDVEADLLPDIHAPEEAAV